jgi:hypothetical protein
MHTSHGKLRITYYNFKNQMKRLALKTHPLLCLQCKEYLLTIFCIDLLAIYRPNPMCQTKLKMSSESETSHNIVVDSDVTEKLTSLKDKINRTTKFLKELRTLSKACQEGDFSNHPEDTDDEAIRERQVHPLDNE